jgi:hypothetical protein
MSLAAFASLAVYSASIFSTEGRVLDEESLLAMVVVSG